ncbi:MAG: DUF4395 family protein [Gammaproteobacteria bacterium]|nr:DUF4395 family protein [Gammaproteobacteria bacterium]
MDKRCTLSFQHRSLVQQGYQRYTPVELRQLEWGLRFTPAACSLLALYGLYTQQPVVLFIVALLGIWAFFFPAGHPMDLIYNRLLAPAIGAVKLPENPFQRRLACLSAGLMNITAGVLFLLGLPMAALVVGASLLVLQAIVIFTHFCTLSWIYEGLMRLLGKWQVPVEESKAKTLLKAGALLVDVRSQNEFSKQPLPGAINLPLEDLPLHLEQFKRGVCLLYCNSGTRSYIATEKLKAQGLQNVYNLGSYDRAQRIAVGQ